MLVFMYTVQVQLLRWNIPRIYCETGCIKLKNLPVFQTLDPTLILRIRKPLRDKIWDEKEQLRFVLDDVVWC